MRSGVSLGLDTSVILNLAVGRNRSFVTPANPGLAVQLPFV